MGVVWGCRAMCITNSQPISESGLCYYAQVQLLVASADGVQLMTLAPGARSVPLHQCALLAHWPRLM